MYIITSIVVAANICNSFLKKHIQLISWSLILLLCVLMGTNTRNPDYYNYRLMFMLKKSTIEFGFTSLIYLFRSIGLNYHAFRLFLTILGFVLIHHTVKKVTDRPSFFYILYMIYPFFLDAVQIRNFVAMAILIFAFPFLMKTDVKSKFYYILLIFLATSMHIMSLVYLLFLLIEPIQKSTKFARIYFIIVMILGLVSLNRALFESIVEGVIRLLAMIYPQIGYYGDISTRYGFLIYWGIQIGFTMLLKILIDQMRNANDIDILKERKDWMIRFSEVVFYANLISMIFLPTYVIHTLYFRFFRNLIPLNFLVLIGGLSQFKFSKKTQVSLIGAFLFLAFALVFIEVFLYYRSEIVDAIFNHSWLIPRDWQ